MKKKLLLFFSCFFIVILICQTTDIREQVNELSVPRQAAPLTVFIHGTLPQTLIRGLLSKYDLGRGLFNAQQLGNTRWFLGKIGWWLHEGDPVQFPLETTYLYGWTGALNFQAREQEAEALYLMLRNYPGPITVIGHSHGGNVGLLLAKAAQNHHDTTFRIDRLVLLATPIQAVTMQYINSPVFRQIYSLYAASDMIQILDPQKMYRYTKALEQTHLVPFFSDRVIEIRYPHLIQARISTGRIGPSHMSFIMPAFLHRLGEIFDVLATVAQKARRNNGPQHVLLKVHKHKPVYVEKAL